MNDKDKVKEPEVLRCSDCKHFLYDSRKAHKNLCGKFKERGEPQPCALVRSDKGPCGGHGKAHEK